MGNRCLRPISQDNDPVYISSINSALIQAQKIFQQKKQLKQMVTEEIIKNQNRKGHLKKLFDHFVSHQKNILPAIKYCNKMASQEKSYSSVVICNMFCERLVKFIANKKIKNATILKEDQNIHSKIINSTKSLFSFQIDYKSLLHQLQAHFFQLIIKIILYNNKQKIIQTMVSETLVQYCNEIEDKLTAKKEIINLLDVFLTIVLQKNMKVLNKSSYLPFYAYSTLLQKSKTELFSTDFIEKHFNFILKIFFELEDLRGSSKSIIENEEFFLFEACVQNIVKQFILFSTQNKKIKDKIFSEIICELDIEKFNQIKVMKLQKIVRENLNCYNTQHFMFDWLGYLLRYMGKRAIFQHQLYKDSNKSKDSAIQYSLQHIQVATSCKNIGSLESRVNCFQTLKRWFDEQLLKLDKMLQYFSERIFQVLLLNLYGPNGINQEISNKSQQILAYFLDKQPSKIREIFCLINRELRKAKNQIYSQQVHQLTVSNKGLIHRKSSIQQISPQNLWENDLTFLGELSKKEEFSKIQLVEQQIIQIFFSIPSQLHPSINLIYIVELAGVALNHVNLHDQVAQNEVYQFLVSLTSAAKISNSQFQINYEENLILKLNFLFREIKHRNKILLYCYLKHSIANIQRDSSIQSIWIEILIISILSMIVLQENQHSESNSQLQQLKKFKGKILKLIGLSHSQRDIFQCYQQNVHLLNIETCFTECQRVSKTKNYKRLQQSLDISGARPKTLNYESGSILQSNYELSSSNPDNQLRNIISMVAKT